MDPVTVMIARNEMEAELVCGALRDADILCTSRITNMGWGSGGEIALSGGGPRAILVNADDLVLARDVVRGFEP